MHPAVAAAGLILVLALVVGALAVQDLASARAASQRAALVDIPAGETATQTVRWQEPLTGPAYQLGLQPQPVVNPATLTVSGSEPLPFTRTAAFEVPTDCPA